MASADFCIALPTPLDAVSTWQAMQTSPGMRTHLHAYARRIYVQLSVQVSGFEDICLLTQRAASYALPVRRASALPAASFRFHLTMDTLAVRLTVPLVGSVEDLHLQVSAPCRAHQLNRGRFFGPLCFSVNCS